MSFTAEQIAKLEAPLNRANVKTREQAGRELSYIEAWHAIAEANRIFGFSEWDRETTELRLLGDPRDVSGKWRVGYMAKVRVTVRAGDTHIVREGCGFGSGIDKDPDQAHESALKEAESDAMKRALMTFGNLFGLALYDKAQANVAVVVEEPKISGACELAIGFINRCTSRAELRELWGKNVAGWNASFTDHEKAALVAARDETGAKLPEEKEAA